MAGVTAQELAVRTAILDVATAGTLLQKVDSPGRLYSSITKAQLKVDIGVKDEFIELTDTPNEYSSADINKILQIKDDLSGVEFTDSPIFASVTIDNIIIPDIYTAQTEPTGFVDRDAVLSWDDATHTLTITGVHDIYINGVKTTKTTDSIQISDTTNLYYIYYNTSGILSYNVMWPGFDVPLLAFVYWNTAIDKGLISEERHGIIMDGDTHGYLHETIGVRYESGLTGTFDATTLNVTAGVIHDEDLKIDISEQTTCTVMYKNGDVNWEWDANSAIYYKLNGTALRYNNGNVLADCALNKYMAMWIFATNDISTPIVALMGQRTDTKLSSAKDNNTYESLSFGVLPFQEMKILFRVILRNTGAPPTYVETLDLRAVSTVSSGTYTATAHSILTGLDSDDHKGYALLAGRIEGQELFGSNVTAEDLTLTDNSVDNNSITVIQAISAYTHSQIVGGDSVHVSVTENTNWDSAYTHSQLTSGNPHSVTPTELSLVVGTDVQAWDTGLDALAALTYVTDSFIKVTATDTYAIRTVAETKTDLSLNLVENTALSTWAGTTNITTLGTVGTGTWGATDIAIAHGGTGQSTAQAAIDALSAVSAATNEHVLTKDTVTGNVKWKVASGGSLTFLDLTDTPTFYSSDDIGKYAAVKSDLSGLEFVDSSSGSGYTSRMRAYLSANQNIDHATYTKVLFNIETFDSDDEYDKNNNYRFTATSAGYYLVTSKVMYSAT